MCSLIDFIFRWLQSRKKDDNAEGLWRVHDSLYDLTEFINWHPGGTDWIKLTKVNKNFVFTVHLFRITNDSII